MRATGWTRGLLVLGLGGLLITGCAASAFTKDETPGQRFERAMKVLAENCARNPPKPGDATCDRLKLKPADPLATEEGRFAHSIKIPNPVPADSGYKPGMTPEQYFEHLCKTEAGEFIYKTVENVEGLYLMRARTRPTDYELENLYALEDPYGAVQAGASKPQDYLIQLPFGPYAFLEMPSSSESKTRSADGYTRYFRGSPENSKREFVYMKDSHSERVPYIVETESITSLKSRFGYTWRGIQRSHDRELGVAGSEWMVLDLETKEVLGVQRWFIRSGGIRDNLTGIWWLNGQVCRQYRGEENSPLNFVKKVLKPRP
jgi:hypothetical protein